MTGRLPVRAAIAHDWFQGMHGAERVVEAMLDLFEPDPDIFTFMAARELLPPRLRAAIKHDARLARLPGLRQVGHAPGRWRALLPYMPTWWAQQDLGDYDVVIASSHACAIQARPRPDALHLCYCYTPMRYVWHPDTDAGRVRGAKALGMRVVRERLRALDLAASRRPDAYVAISTAIAERIEAVYGRTATVVHPPVQLPAVGPEVPRDPTRFLWVHRLVPYKRPLEVAEAFRHLPDLELTMVGVGPVEEELRARMPPNVRLLGWLERVELAELYATANGFIHVGEEDFGITMVEALAHGTPVLALDRGGARDIVREGESGVLIDDGRDPRKIAEGVRGLAEGSWDRPALRDWADGFGEDRFHEKMTAVLRAHGA